MTSAQFLNVWEFIEIAQAKVIEEKSRGLVEQRTTWDLCAPGNFYQAAFHQGLQNAVDRHAAHRFNIGAGARLPISDDGKRLQRGRRQPGRLWHREKSTDPTRIF